MTSTKEDDSTTEGAVPTDFNGRVESAHLGSGDIINQEGPNDIGERRAKIWQQALSLVDRLIDRAFWIVVILLIAGIVFAALAGWAILK